jgi:hypothetical protein
MAGKMQTFVMKRIGEVGIMEKPAPTPGPNGAVIKTTAILVCTSDTHTAGGAIGVYDREGGSPGPQSGADVHCRGDIIDSAEQEGCN